jgi:hypothetical protein
MAKVPIDSAFWFQIARGERPLKDIPGAIGTKTLKFVNSATPQQLVDAAPLLGEEDRAVALAAQILPQKAAPYKSLEQLRDTPGLGPARFVELVRSIAQTDPVTPTTLGYDGVQPAQMTFSASETELQFSYEILGGPPRRGGGGGAATARYCTACESSSASFNLELDRWETQVKITGLILDGEDKNMKFSIQMDLRMLPYDWMQPLDEKAKQFQFPAKMQLNNSMIIDAEIKGTGQRMTLVSRDVPCQVGRVTSWPPYKMMLHTQDQVTYYNQADPLGQPVMRILDGTTYLFGPDFFFSLRTDITRYEYVQSAGERGLPAIALQWDAKLGGQARIDHYRVFRTANPAFGEGSWIDVSGPVKGGQWVDPNPPHGPTFYRVAPVMKDIFGKDYQGFPGQIRRVESGGSIFRK